MDYSLLPAQMGNWNADLPVTHWWWHSGGSRCNLEKISIEAEAIAHGNDREEEAEDMCCLQGTQQISALQTCLKPA